MVLLPRLMTFNGKNVSTTATHLRYVYTENLRTRVSLFPGFTEAVAAVAELDVLRNVCVAMAMPRRCLHPSRGSIHVKVVFTISDCCSLGEEFLPA